MVFPEPTSNLPLREYLQQQMTTLSLQEMEMLLAWLKVLIKEHRQDEIKASIPLKKGREVVETLNQGTTIYRLEKVKCGKKKCKCRKGSLHGPYWYAYHWNGKKVSSTYIGKELTEAVLGEMTQTSPEEGVKADTLSESTTTSDPYPADVQTLTSNTH